MMKYWIKVKTLTAQLAFHEPYFGPNSLLFYLVQILQLFQFIGIILPNVRKYDDPIFYMFKVLVKQLILDTNTLQETYIYIVLIAQLMLIGLVIIQKYTLIYYYAISLITIFKIPLYSIILQQLMLKQNSISLNIIAFLEGIFIIFQTIYIQYFLRQTKLIPQNLFLRKHSFIDHFYLEDILCLASIIVYYSNTTQLLKLSTYILYSICKFATHYLNRPYSYPYDSFNTSIIAIQLFSCLMFLINELSDNNLFTNGSLILSLLVLMPLIIAISSQCYKIYDQFNSKTQDLMYYLQFIYYHQNKIDQTQYEKIVLQIEYAKHQPCKCKLNQMIPCLLKNRTDLNSMLLSCDYCILDDNPVHSYIKLKEYHISYPQSLYFQWTINKLYDQLEKSIRLKQQDIITQSDIYQEIRIQDLQKFQTRQDEVIHQMLYIQDQKIIFWETQIKGVKNIYELKDQLMSVITYVQRLQQLIDIEFTEEIKLLNSSRTPRNILNLKLLSLFYAFVLNDPFKTHQSEEEITNTLIYESTLPNNLISFLSCFEDRLLYISISLIKNLGMIINKDKSNLLKLFHYQNEDKDFIQKINQLMPTFIAQYHDSYLQNFKQQAMSQYFISQKQVFGQVKEGFLLPFQLKLLSDFALIDDYAMQGMLFLKANCSDYIIFQSDFKILGMTQKIFDTLLKQTSIISYESIIRIGYMYLLFPKIIRIMQELESKFKEENQISDETIFIWRPDFYAFLLEFNSLHANSNLSSLQQITNSQLNYKTFGQINQYDPKTEKTAKDYLKQHQGADNIAYVINYIISKEYIAKNESVQEYYIMEVIDYQKISQDKQILDTQPQIIDDQVIDNQEIRFDQDVSDQIIRFQQNEDPGPTQLRAFFISPQVKAVREDTIELEDLTKRQEQFPFVNNYLSAEFEVSQERKSESDLVRKTHRDIQQEMEVGSKVSTKTSSSNPFLVIQQFQYQKKASLNILFLSILNISVFLILLMIIIIHAIQLNTQYNLIVYAQNQLSGPLIFNQIFTSLTTLPWLLIFQSKIFNNSQLIQNSIYRQIADLNKYAFSNISDQYVHFINIEQQNLLTPQILDLRIYPSLNLTYTSFIDVLENYANNIFNMSIENGISKSQMDSLLILRANINTIYSMNMQIITSLNTIYLNNANQFASNQQSQISLESTLISFIFVMQIFLWRNIHMHDQILILLLGRQNEQELRDLINGSTEVKRMLLSKNIKFDWKRSNIFNFMYADQTWKLNKNNQKQTKNKALKQNYVNSRINSTRINLIKHILILFFVIGGIFAYFQGLQQIVLSQNQLVKPQQTLATNFLQVNLQINTLAALSIITKSEPLIWTYLKNNYNYTDLEIKFNQTTVFTLFSTLFKTFNVKFQTVFKGIILSTQLSDTDKNNLFTLYNGDICLFATSIPFCQYDSLSEQVFIQKYGNYNLEDDNRAFLKIGLIGIVSNMELLLKGSYNSEIQNKTYSQSTQSDLNLFQTQLFINTLTEYFIDAYQALNLFYNILLNSILQILHKNFTNQCIYLFLGGLPLVVIYITTFLIWINRTYEEMIKIRLGLLMMSTDSLLTPQTISVLRQLR